MNEAFASKLNEIFNVNATLAVEAQNATRQIGAVANALNESGQDFVKAAEAFRQTDFASSLQQSVESLLMTRVQLTDSTESLCSRLSDVRDNLFASQAEWKLLAKTAEIELESCRTASTQIQQEVGTLRTAVCALEQGTQSASESAKQLREARLEVMRDRKLAIGIAETVQTRLASDSSIAESCQVFASSLEAALSNWNQNVGRLDKLCFDYVDSVKNARLEDEQILAGRSRSAREALDNLRNQLQQDLGTAIESQRNAIARLAEPTRSAQELSQRLLEDLEELKSKVSALGENLQIGNDSQPRGR
jgi:hypothetical protein